MAVTQSKLITMSELAGLLGLSRQLAHYYLRVLEIPVTAAGRSQFVHEDQVSDIVSRVAAYRQRERKRK